MCCLKLNRIESNPVSESTNVYYCFLQVRIASFVVVSTTTTTKNSTQLYITNNNKCLEKMKK